MIQKKFLKNSCGKYSGESKSTRIQVQDYLDYFSFFTKSAINIKLTCRRFVNFVMFSLTQLRKEANNMMYASDRSEITQNNTY